MWSKRTGAACMVLGFVSMAAEAIAQPPQHVYDSVIERAVSHLPRRPALVAVIDAEQARPEVKPLLLSLDAFIAGQSRVVYLVKQSSVLKAAIERSPLYEFMLASIIWHEMAHLEGADEQEARRREQEMWTTYVRDGSVNRIEGLTYLSALNDRPALTSRAPRPHRLLNGQ